jgi:hypothetical protein
MKLITLIIIVTVHLTALGESNLQNASKEVVKLSKIDLIIMKRSILLLGNNSRPDTPKFSSMHYDEKANELIQFYTLKEEDIDKVLSGDKKAIEVFQFKYKMERSSIQAGYLRLNPKDIFKMHFASIGGGKGFIVSKDGVSKR